MKKESLFILIATILFTIIIAKYYFTTNQEVNEVVEIAAILPLTGEIAVYGKNTQKGIDLAIQKINSGGGINGKMIKVIYEDSKADPSTSVSAINKIISTTEVQYIIDNSVSSVALAITPVATKNKIVVLSTGSTSPNLSGISPYFFRIWNSDDFEGQIIAQFAVDSLNIDDVAVLYMNNDYGIGLKNVFEKEYLRNGGRNISSYAFEQNTKKIDIILQKVNNNQALYLVGYTLDNATIIKKLKELGYSGTILGTVTMEDKKVIELCGEAANGIIYPFPSNLILEESNVKIFKESFMQKYGVTPGITADVGYDAVLVFAEALKELDEVNGETLANYFSNDFHLYGASGLIEFDENGDVHKPMTIKKIDGSKFVNY